MGTSGGRWGNPKSEHPWALRGWGNDFWGPWGLPKVSILGHFGVGITVITILGVQSHHTPRRRAIIRPGGYRAIIPAGGIEPSYAQWGQSLHTPRGYRAYAQGGTEPSYAQGGREPSYAQGIRPGVYRAIIRPGGYRAIIRHPRWCPLYTILVHWYPVHIYFQ